MLKVVDVIGLASTGAYEGDASLETRTNIVRIAPLGSGSSLRVVVLLAPRCNTPPADHEGVSVAYVCRLLPLTCLAPAVVEMILDGRQPKGLRLAEMLGNGPLAWHEQRARWSV